MCRRLTAVEVCVANWAPLENDSSSGERCGIINVGALVNSSHFTTAILSQNALPLISAAGLGSLAVPNVVSCALDVTTRTSIPGVTNSGANSIFNDGTTQLAGVLRAMKRDGLIRTLAEPCMGTILSRQVISTD